MDERTGLGVGRQRLTQAVEMSPRWGVKIDGLMAVDNALCLQALGLVRHGMVGIGQRQIDHQTDSGLTQLIQLRRRWLAGAVQVLAKATVLTDGGEGLRHHYMPAGVCRSINGP